jgi:hypothetical protein
MRSLLRLYPPAWRARYGEEFEALLAELRPSPRIVLDLLFGAWDAHWRVRLVDVNESDRDLVSGDFVPALAAAAALGGALTVAAGLVGVGVGVVGVPGALLAGLAGLSLTAPWTALKSRRAR